MMKKILTVFFLACLSCAAMAQDNVIDEIVWVVGDDAILRSDVETQRLYMQNEGGTDSDTETVPEPGEDRQYRGQRKPGDTAG